MDLTKEVIEKAYLYLKSHTYHENLNLFLKERVAEFECNVYDEAIEAITRVVNADSAIETPEFKAWLKDIDYHLLPKSVDRPEDTQQNDHNKDNGLFITNVTVSEKYQISKVNYLINAPVELHIIEVLWCLYVAPILEAKLTKDCYGNRMNSFAKEFCTNTPEDSSGSTELFKRYIEQYNLWRDQAIDIATNLANSQEDVALLSLDLKSYFYHINFDFDDIRPLIDEVLNDKPNIKEIATQLTDALELIHKTYGDKTYNLAKQTHSDCKDKWWLPIGFASSSIIANWYLSDFDHEILGSIRPSYYGRYVDDIILVFKRPQFESERPIDSFIEHYLAELVKYDNDIDSYYITVGTNHLPIQKDKLILQYFEKDHSRAGLEVFKQELEERSSAFKFLPSDHIDKGLGNFAYDVLYDGSANKLRSVVGLAENETELAKYLSSHITAHRLCKLDNNDVVLPELSLFFKGANALRFSRLWEKVYQYALVIKNYHFINSFFEYLSDEILKIEGINLNTGNKRKNLTDTLITDLNDYNRISLSMTIALLDVQEPTWFGQWDLDNIFHSNKKGDLLALIGVNGFHQLIWSFRKTNLVRHHLVAWPLANYSDFEGDLTDEHSFVSIITHKLSNAKVSLTPRFIHYDEWQLFHLPAALKKGNELSKWQTKTIKAYRKIGFGENFPVSFHEDTTSGSVTKSTFTVGNNSQCSNLRIALANICIDEENINAAIRKDRKPNVSFRRQEALYQILNTSIKEKADLLVMPEVSIPVSWLPFMVAHARRHQIGIIFGLEHWVIDDKAYNLIIEVLPFKVSNRYNSCAMTARLKNHYAPAELELIDVLRLKPANTDLKPNNYYHKVRWNGACFSTYNCFELSDIEHRSLFKSEVDLLFACVWNRDTNYYQHILESAVRDLHCYVVQSNTSQYGGSCVLRPTKTESKTMLYVKGGNNTSVLTIDLDIAKLREFQYKSKPDVKDSFKHLPPGFDCDGVPSR